MCVEMLQGLKVCSVKYFSIFIFLLECSWFAGLCQFLLYRVIFKVLKVLCGLSIHLPQPWQPLISLFLKLLFIFYLLFPQYIFFLLYSMVTQLHIHAYILFFSHYHAPSLYCCQSFMTINSSAGTWFSLLQAICWFFKS